MILRGSGFDATSFVDPQEALRAAHLEAPDLLISDVLMPLMTGIDLAIQVQAASPSSKVLLFSGQATTRELLEDAGALGHTFEIISKPVHPTELLARIKKATAE
jgi:DNA-binding NtrC family response regulator